MTTTAASCTTGATPTARRKATRLPRPAAFLVVLAAACSFRPRAIRRSARVGRLRADSGPPNCLRLAQTASPYDGDIFVQADSACFDMALTECHRNPSSLGDCAGGSTGGETNGAVSCQVVHRAGVHCARRRGARVRQFLVGGFHRSPRAFAWSSIRASRIRGERATGARVGDLGGGRARPKVFSARVAGILRSPPRQVSGPRSRLRASRGSPGSTADSSRRSKPESRSSPPSPRALGLVRRARSGGDKTSVSGASRSANAASV